MRWHEPGCNARRVREHTSRPELLDQRPERVAPQCGLRLISLKVYASGVEDLLPLPLRLAWKVVSMTLRIATLGRYDPDQTDAVLIFRKA